MRAARRLGHSDYHLFAAEPAERKMGRAFIFEEGRIDPRFAGEKVSGRGEHFGSRHRRANLLQRTCALLIDHKIPVRIAVTFFRHCPERQRLPVP